MPFASNVYVLLQTYASSRIWIFGDDSIFYDDNRWTKRAVVTIMFIRN